MVFKVLIKNDTMYEADENFTLTIDSSTLPDNVLVGNHSQASVIIVNDDGK